MRAYAKHVYLNMVTGEIDNPGRGNLSWASNPDYTSIGHYHTYSTINSQLDESLMEWVVTRGKNVIGRYPLRREHIVKRAQRIADHIEEVRRIIELNKPENIMTEVKKAVEFIEDLPLPEPGDERYWINVYHGCGVYRLVIKDGKIVASLKGGFHDSCPYGIDKQRWYDAISLYLTERLGEQGYENPKWRFVKADGSGTYFYLRDPDDEVLIKTKNFTVPAPNGDGNMGFNHFNQQIL